MLIHAVCTAEGLPATPKPMALDRVTNCRDAITKALVSPYVRRSPCSSPAGPHVVCRTECAAAVGGWKIVIEAGDPEPTYQCRLLVSFDLGVTALLPCGIKQRPQ
jgi:hypothetical protein